MKSFIVAGAILGCSASVQAQQIAVQQPVVATNSVQTTVSVPDRGSTLLGGVGSAQLARSSYGPLRSGTSTGLSSSASSISTSVYIHDLRAMDEELLNSVPSSQTSVKSRDVIRPRAADAPVAEVTSPAEKVKKFEHLARTAEAAGKVGAAKLYWQVAAKYGSKVANVRLNAMASAESAARQSTTND